MPHQLLRENTASRPHGKAVISVDLHALHAAARRILLQHVSAQHFRRERVDAIYGVLRQPIGQIDAAFTGEQPDARVNVDETHRFPRCAEAAFDLGTDWYPLDETA